MSTAIHDMFSSIAHRYDLANDVLSMGMHRLWRRTVAGIVSARAPLRALDLCCGTGDLSFAVSRALPATTVVGVDFVQQMLDGAERKKAGARNVSFVRGDATALPIESSSVDLVTVAFGVRNIPRLDRCLDEISRVLASGGSLIVLEFGQIRIPILRALYDWYCRVLMPRIGGLLTGNRSAYEYLPQTSLQFPAGEAFLNILAERGYVELRAKSLIGGLAYIYTATSAVSPGASLGQSAVLG